MVFWGEFWGIGVRSGWVGRGVGVELGLLCWLFS